MKKINIIIATITAIILGACEISEFDLQQNPNNPIPELAEPNLVLNNIQLTLGDAMSVFGRNTDDVMRYEAMTATYADLTDDTALDGEWNDVYLIRQDLQIIDSLTAEDSRLRFHRGIGKVIAAYAMVTMVDYFGDVPFAEANNLNNLNPAVTSGEEIYNAILSDLDAAIDDLSNIDLEPTTDIYYNDETLGKEEKADKWIKVANTIKFKMLVNTGDQAGINALLAQDNLIEDSEDDFEFTYGILAEPESRHRYFQRSYVADGPSEYIGNNFMFLLKDSKTVRDPRLRYYVYRQTDTDPNLACANDPEFDFCYIGDFYWGRDHGHDDPRPNDGFLKSIYGLYPAGGAFDADNPTRGARSANAGGAGIFPMLLSSYTNFLKAEAALRIGTNGDPAILLETGIRHSMDKVLNFRGAAENSPFAATPEDVDAYVAEVMNEYNLATNEGKLDVVMREYYLASYGNAIESYNGYRRTGFPSSLQEPIRNTSIPFPRVYSLPDDAINNNTSISQRPITTQVFWDTNPAGFIK